MLFAGSFYVHAAFPLTIPERPNLPLQRPTEVGWIWAWGGPISDPATTSAHGRYGYVAIKATVNADFAITADGRLDTWPATFATNMPPEVTNVVAVAAGNAHAIALRADGVLVGWGDNTYGQLNIPPNATNVVSIECGPYNSMALMADGSVAVWGLYADGLLVVPPTATNVVAIALNTGDAAALRADGFFLVWGSPQVNAKITTIPPGLGSVVAVDLGAQHAIILQADGLPIAWGNNSSYQTNVPPGLSNVVAIAASYNHNITLKSDGTLEQWGLGWGRLNFPEKLSDVIAISAGGDHSMALHRRNGEALVAAAHVTIQNGFVVGAVLEDPGNGYQTAPVVTLVGGGGSGAQITATVASGKITQLTVNNAGSGYTSPPEVRIAPPESFQLKIGGAASRLWLTFKVVPNIKYRLESSIDGGANWVSNSTFIAASPSMKQEVVVSQPPSIYRLVQVGAAGTAVRNNGFITGINRAESGSGYVNPPTVTIIGGGGTGATAIANISDGAVASFTVTSAGSGYTSTPEVIVEPPPPAPGYVFTAPSRVSVTQYVEPGFKYELDVSSDLNRAWTPTAPAAVTRTNRIVGEYPLANAIQFFRIQQIP
jgi:alpha-tubulin suppressor-like RCC1 family protein